MTRKNANKIHILSTSYLEISRFQSPTKQEKVYNNYKLFPVLTRIFVKNSHTYEKNNYFNDDRRDAWLLRL